MNFFYFQERMIMDGMRLADKLLYEFVPPEVRGLYGRLETQWWGQWWAWLSLVVMLSVVAGVALWWAAA
jgi:hypothetical protein